MEDVNASLLLAPTPKKRTRFAREYPFPIVRNDNDSAAQEFECYVGHLQEDCVLVYEEESIKILYKKGFFGKGTLSKHAPQVCFKKKEIRCSENVKESATTSQFIAVDASDEEIEVVECDDNDERPRVKQKREKDEIEVVLSDSSAASDEAKGRSPEKNEATTLDSSSEKEYLQLTFEEAYFLSYGLGCLVVKDDKDQPLDLTRLWNRLCELSTGNNFPVMYTAYHHFRSKGWIVKNGTKYGVDYVLYKDGPPFYHATYSVLVKPVKEQNLRDASGGCKQLFTWASLSALNRINICAGKGLLLLYVIKPNTMSENKISTPFCISQYKLEEVLFKRWVPSESREEDDW